MGIPLRLQDLLIMSNAFINIETFVNGSLGGTAGGSVSPHSPISSGSPLVRLGTPRQGGSPFNERLKCAVMLLGILFFGWRFS